MTALVASIQVPERGIDIAFDFADSALAVLGPNGSGKSTLLAAILGQLRPRAGRIELNDRVLFDSVSGVDIPAYRRRIALLTQQPMLFPHMSVIDNVVFAARSVRSRSTVRVRAQGWLARVGADHLAERRATELSGGQAQRVALARALAAEPELLLLDEPLAAIDVEAAAELRQILRDVLRTNVNRTILVTHDVIDAVAATDSAIVIEDGRITHRDPITAILERPHTTFAASLAGLNLVVGQACSDALVTPGGLTLAAGAVRAERGTAAVAVFAPTAVVVHAEPPGGSARNVLPATVRDIGWHGGIARVRSVTPVGIVDADITAAAIRDLQLTTGSSVYLAVKAVAITVHPRKVG